MTLTGTAAHQLPPRKARDEPGQLDRSAARVKRNPAVPTLLRLVPRLAEVTYLRRKPLAERVQQEGLATLRDAADWQELSRMVFGDDRIAETKAVPLERDGNVIRLPVRKQRSSSLEIQAVRLSEERRGKRR